MAERTLHRARVETRPRFRCLVCKRFVEGTEHGSCPRCAWEPPRVELPRPPPERAARGGRMAALAIVLAAMAVWFLTRA